MSDGAAVREWRRRLDEDGAVDFGRSYGWLAVRAMATIAFIAGGVVMAVSGSPVAGPFVTAVFALFLAQVVIAATAPGPALRVDHGGLTVGYRTPLRIAWSDVRGVTIFKVNRFAKSVVSVHTAAHVVADYRTQVSLWTRTLMRLRIIGPDPESVKIDLVKARTNALAAWLDSLVAQHEELSS